ncbi:MAG: hypothetical protein K6346_01195, partial [Halothiobacillaceae bacterium]
HREWRCVAVKGDARWANTIHPWTMPFGFAARIPIRSCGSLNLWLDFATERGVMRIWDKPASSLNPHITYRLELSLGFIVELPLSCAPIVAV